MLLPPIASPNLLRTSFDQRRHKEAILGLLTRMRVPFSVIERIEMKDSALACNSAIEDLSIISERSVMCTIVANYESYCDQIRKSFLEAVSPIHIPSDLWTSPHRHGMLAVCAQWVDQKFELQKAFLVLPECRPSHTGENQASLIIETVGRFGVEYNIGFHAGDNATLNNTCLRSMEICKPKGYTALPKEQRGFLCKGYRL